MVIKVLTNIIRKMPSHLLPCLDTNITVTNQFTHAVEPIMIALCAYFSAVLFITLFVFLVYNIVEFLIKQKKWRVWSLLLFYGLAFICVVLRIWISIMVVCVTKRWNLIYALSTAVIKICIGIEQIMVIIEIIMKVRAD